MKFEEVLTESYKVAVIKYKGSRKDYIINDPMPTVLVLDDNYNVDGNGDSVLGINLNYIDPDANNIEKIIKDINNSDNKAGYRFFDTKTKVKQFLSRNKEKSKQEEIDARIARYKNFIDNFPDLGSYIRRYKKSAIEYRGKY